MDEIRWGIIGCGLILDVGSHALDLLDFYFGPIAEVRAFASNQGDRTTWRTR